MFKNLFLLLHVLHYFPADLLFSIYSAIHTNGVLFARHIVSLYMWSVVGRYRSCVCVPSPIHICSTRQMSPLLFHARRHCLVNFYPVETNNLVHRSQLLSLSLVFRAVFLDEKRVPRSTAAWLYIRPQCHGRAWCFAHARLHPASMCTFAILNCRALNFRFCTLAGTVSGRMRTALWTDTSMLRFSVFWWMRVILS